MDIYQRTKSKNHRLSLSASIVVGVIATVLTILTSCGRIGRIGEEQSDVYPYETLWVDPRIVHSDTLLTLIRADRIDSILIDPAAKPSPRSASVEIRIYESACNVSVNLLDSGEKLLYPLLVRNLPQGFYRLTVEFGRFSSPPLLPGDYVLQADYCQQINRSGFSIEY